MKKCSKKGKQGPFNALFSVFSSSNPLKTLLSFLTTLLHPLCPESLSYHCSPSSNPLKTLSIVLFTPLLSPLTHYSQSFPLQIHSKPCFPFLLHFFTLYALSHSLIIALPLQIHSKPYPLFCLPHCYPL